MKTMPPVTLESFEDAPFLFTANAVLPHTPAEAFAELADPARWPAWFPLMRSAAWTSAETSRVGAEREVAMRLFGRFQERILAWEPGARFAFTMTASASPLVDRMGEDYRLTPERDGVRLTWVVAAVPTTLGRVGAPALRLVLSRMFRGAVANLRERAESPARAHGTHAS
jgi:uncharacterized protein YndB with AHSA1/START domain